MTESHDERARSSRVAAEYGCIVTFENAGGRTLTLTRWGAPAAALRALCASARAKDDTFRAVSYSTPETILRDMQGARPVDARLPEQLAFGQARCADDLHPRLRGTGRDSARYWRQRDAAAKRLPAT